MKTESLGQRLVRLRSEKGLGQKELAEKARCNPQTVGYLERDQKGTNIWIVADIARALDVSIDYLVYGKEHHGSATTC